MRVEIDGTRHHKCDWCRRDFTAEQAPHVTLHLGPRSGMSAPQRLRDDALPGWRFAKMFKPQFLDFCLPTDESCMAEWLHEVVHNNPAEYVQ